MSCLNNTVTALRCCCLFYIGALVLLEFVVLSVVYFYAFGYKTITASTAPVSYTHLTLPTICSV